MGGERQYHLAQVNVGRLRAPIDDPLIAGFAGALEEINALADAARGFVWRLQTDDGDATAVRAFPDDTVLINLSVWTSLEALGDYVYRSDHTTYLRRRAEWFERVQDTTVALWWVPAGPVPPEAVAVAKLDRHRRHGPTAEAFTFRHPFVAPDGGSAPIAADDRDVCPA